MATGTVVLGETPCCGVVERTYESIPDQGMTTGIRHMPGAWGAPVYGDKPLVRGDQDEGPYAPTFEEEARQIDSGVCPDCGKPFLRREAL